MSRLHLINRILETLGRSYMLFSSKTVFQNLPHNYYAAPGTSWYLNSRELEPKAQIISDYISNPFFTPEKIQLLKQGPRRLIFRIMPVNSKPVVIKSFPFKTLKDKIYRHRRYAPNEAKNLFIASDRSIPVPQILGYGEMSRYRLVLANMIMMEDLNEHTTFMDLLKDCGPSFALALLQKRITPIFLSLYHGRCNNIDVNNNSIRLHLTDPRKDKVIDFQYTNYLNKPSITTLIYQTAHYGRSISKHGFDEELLEEWVVGILKTLSIKDTDRWIKTYRKFFITKPPRSDRLKLR